MTSVDRRTFLRGGMAASGLGLLTACGTPSKPARWILPSDSRVKAAEAARRTTGRTHRATLNAEAGPVWDDPLLATVVTLAHESHLPVVAHAQGAGHAERALTAGVDVLAHTPWSESLSDAVIARMAARMAWISTLDIHGWGSYGADFDRAFGNLERFVAAGGTVHYGTDLGNGPLPAGLNRRELEALQGAGVDLVAALRGLLPTDDRLAQDVPADTLADITVDALLASTVKDRT